MEAEGVTESGVPQEYLVATPGESENPPYVRFTELTEKIDRMAVIIHEQQETIQRLNAERESNRTVSLPTPKFNILKPRDISKLTLVSLEGLAGKCRLRSFISQIEQISPDDKVRVQVAKTKFDERLELLIHQEEKKGVTQTWTELTSLLAKKFATVTTVTEAWAEIDGIRYCWPEPLSAFVNEVRCKFAMIESNFPTQVFPDLDQTIKRKVFRGVPADIQVLVDMYLEPSTSLSVFIERVNHERQRYVNGDPGYVLDCDTCHVKNTTKPKTEGQPEVTNDEIKELTRKVDQLMRERPRTRWCVRCQSNTHDTQRCWAGIRENRNQSRN